VICLSPTVTAIMHSGQVAMATASPAASRARMKMTAPRQTKAIVMLIRRNFRAARQSRCPSRHTCDPNSCGSTRTCPSVAR
jgi:hypothetical protein